MGRPSAMSGGQDRVGLVALEAVGKEGWIRSTVRGRGLRGSGASFHWALPAKVSTLHSGRNEGRRRGISDFYFLWTLQASWRRRKRQAWKQRTGHRGSEPVVWTALVVLKERRMYFQGGANRICWKLYMEGERKTEGRHDYTGFNLSNWRKSLAECRRWWGRKALNK